MKKTILLIIIVTSILYPPMARPPLAFSCCNITLTGSTNVSKFILHSEADEEAIVTHSQYEKNCQCLLVTHHLSLKTNDFSSKNKELQKDFCKLLKYKNHPFISIAIKQEFDVDNNSLVFDKNMIVEITITDATRSYAPLYILDKLNADTYHLKAHQTIALSDFNIVAPVKFFGLIKVNELVDVDFSFKFKLTQQGTNEIQHKDTIRTKGNDRNHEGH